jgi:hypothetical protein
MPAWGTVPTGMTRPIADIHDISTDMENPPRYVALLPLRKEARNSTEYTAAFAAQQRLGYPGTAPDIRPWWGAYS